MLAKGLGLKMNMKKLDMMIGKEHLKPEFVKINPQHTVPTLVDNDFVLWESRAILIYLVEKYGKNDKFYPRDPKTRAIVNQRMYFDMGTLFKSFGDYYIPIFMQKAAGDPEKYAKMEEAVKYLDTFLEGKQYAACDEITIADYTLFSSFSTFDVCGFDFTKFENVTRWYENCKNNLKGIEENNEGIEFMKSFIDNHKSQSHSH